MTALQQQLREGGRARDVDGARQHLALGEVATTNAGARVDGRWLSKDKVGLDELADSLACEHKCVS